MAKEKKEKNELKNLIKQEQKRLQADERELQKRRRAIMASCSHREGKNMTIDVEKKGMVRCRTCGSRFNIKTIKAEDLLAATRLVNSALQQVRVVSNTNEDAKAISELGKLAADVISVNDIYARHQERFAKQQNNGGNRNNNNRNNGNKNNSSNFGGYDGIIGVMEATTFYKK